MSCLAERDSRPPATLNYRTTSIFDAAGQLSALVDQKANRTAFTYDLAGRRTQLIDPLNRRLTSTYDVAGRQTQRIDARGFRTTYGYDGLDRVTKRRYPNATRATFAYDAVGNRTQMRDSSGLYTFSYDSLNRVSETRNPLGKVLTYSYDALSRRTRLRDHDGGRFTYAYDDASRLTVVRNPQDQRSSFAYDAGDRRTVVRLGNGTRTSLAYDNASQTTQVFHRKSDGTSIMQLDYRYDAAGNRTVQIEGGTTARTTWAYDAQNQLLGEHRTGTNAYRQTFAYDPAGNRTLKNADGVRTTFNYDAANQLTYSLAAAGRTTFGYDAAGNQRIEQPPVGNRTTTTWDYENQPTQHRLPTGSPVTMTYNADNRRVQSQQSTTVTKFVWDLPTDAYLSELNSANATQVVYTNEPVRYGSVISQRLGSTTHWLHADALGSTRILTTSAGASSDTYLYDAWGNPIASSGSTVNPFRWVGRYGYYYDTVTGLFYIRARSYQPTVARWSSVDPLDLRPATFRIVRSDRQEMRVTYYRYASQSPLTASDSSGLVVVGFGVAMDDLPDNPFGIGLPSPPIDMDDVSDWIKRMIKNIDELSVDACQKECAAWVALDTKLYGDKWRKGLKPCPCDVDRIKDDVLHWFKSVTDVSSHPGCAVCYRSLSWSPNPSAPGQQCCFDARGKLITSGTGAGTVDRINSIKNVVGHFIADVYPYLICSKAGMHDEYLKRRPIDTGINENGMPCPANPTPKE